MTYPSESDFCVFEAGCQKFRQNSRDPDHLMSQHWCQVYSFAFLVVYETLQTKHLDVHRRSLKNTRETNHNGCLKVGDWQMEKLGWEGDLLFTIYSLGLIWMFFTIGMGYQLKNNNEKKPQNVVFS